MSINDADLQLHLKIIEFVLLVANVIDGTTLTSSFPTIDPRIISPLPVHAGADTGGESCLWLE